MRRRSRSTGRCTASIDPYQGSCPVARYLFHDDGTGASSEDSPAARLARPRVPGGLAVSDFPAAPHLSQRDRGRVRPFHPRSESGPRDHRRPGASRPLGGTGLARVGGLDAEFIEALAGEIRDRRPASKDELERIKLRLARAHRLGGLPSDAAILQRIALADREGMKDLLRVKPARTASGVAVVTVMTAPHGCPHGVCTYCPGGPRFGTPQSYLGTEPAARRAADYHYDPRGQTAARIEALQRIGHDTDKVDLIVLGGTFTALEAGYREWFVKGCFDGL